MIKKFFVIILCIFILPVAINAAAITDYLILEDIGQYKLFTGIPGRVFSGPPSKYSQTVSGGVIGSTGHFSENDISYEASYTETSSKWPFVKVEVTKHTGADSDKWLLHEVERGFRRGDHEENMTPARFRSIDNNNIFYSGLGGGTYRWANNNIVVSIEYVDLYKQKSEPLEVVKAYLKKFPSTIPAMTMDKAHNEKWIKDEMDRRLWLCDKWYMAFQLKKVQQADMLKAWVDNMEVFLNYREKYYGIAASSEKQLLWSYLNANNGTAIKAKLDEYKKWWTENKAKQISI